VTLPSLLGPAVQIKYHNDLIGNGHGMEIALGEQRWFVGDLARLQSPYTISPRARGRDEVIVQALMLAALEQLGTKETVHVVTGLPVAWYHDREALVESLRGPQQFAVNGTARSLNVVEVLVVPQPFGSFFQLLLTGDGRLPAESIPLTRQRVAVIDVGTHTTDFALADGLRYVEPKSGSIEVAMARVYELLQRAVEETHGRALSIQDAEEVLQRGTVAVRDREHDVSDLVIQAVGAVALEIVGEAQTLWGDGLDLQTVLLTGGGAAVFLDAIREIYPHATAMPEAQMANAAGFYRYGLRKYT
jgi:plasmid segregation protein ParM